MSRPAELTERFDRSYSVPDGEGCWEWTESRYRNGYGRFGYYGRWRLAHRLAYELAIGPIPDRSVVMHVCNNRKCVNPEHLEIGTQKENLRYMVKCGRQVQYDKRGENNPKARLDEDDVRAIRQIMASGEMNGPELAYFFGVDRHTITAIARRECWKHVA